MQVYLGCQRWSRPEQRVLPWSGGWMDWDHQETKEYEWLEVIFEEEKTNQQRRDAAKQAAASFRGM